MLFPFSGANNIAVRAPAVAPSGVAVEQSSVHTGSTSTDPHTVTLPSGITDGNTLLLIVGEGTNKTLATPSGWSLNSSRTTAAGHTWVFEKVASSDSGASVTLDWSGSTTHASCFYEISCPNGDVEVEWADASIDPPPITPAGGSAEYCFIANVKLQRCLRTLNAAPSGYTGALSAKSQASSSATGESQIGSAYKIATASTEDPGEFTWEASASGVTDTAFTIAVR